MEKYFLKCLINVSNPSRRSGATFEFQKDKFIYNMEDGTNFEVPFINDDEYKLLNVIPSNGYEWYYGSVDITSLIETYPEVYSKFYNYLVHMRDYWLQIQPLSYEDNDIKLLGEFWEITQIKVSADNLREYHSKTEVFINSDIITLKTGGNSFAHKDGYFIHDSILNGLGIVDGNVNLFNIITNVFNHNNYKVLDKIQKNFRLLNNYSLDYKPNMTSIFQFNNYVIKNLIELYRDINDKRINLLLKYPDIVFKGTYTEEELEEEKIKIQEKLARNIQMSFTGYMGFLDPVSVFLVYTMDDYFKLLKYREDNTLEEPKDRYKSWLKREWDKDKFNNKGFLEVNIPEEYDPNAKLPEGFTRREDYIKYLYNLVPWSDQPIITKLDKNNIITTVNEKMKYFNNIKTMVADYYLSDYNVIKDLYNSRRITIPVFEKKFFCHYQFFADWFIKCLCGGWNIVYNPFYLYFRDLIIPTWINDPDELGMVIDCSCGNVIRPEMPDDDKPLTLKEQKIILLQKIMQNFIDIYYDLNIDYIQGMVRDVIEKEIPSYKYPTKDELYESDFKNIRSFNTPFESDSSFRLIKLEYTRVPELVVGPIEGDFINCAILGSKIQKIKFTKYKIYIEVNK